jgi:hypothetical protein
MEIHNQFRVRMFRGSEDLGVLFEAWKCVEEKIQRPSFVQLAEWNEAFIEADPEAKSRFCAILILKADTPFAVIPLEHVSLSRFGLTFGVWRLFWPNDMGINDLACAPDSDLSGVFDAILNTLERQSEPLDLLLFQNALEESSVAALLKTSKPSRTISVHSHDSKYIPCRSSYAATTRDISAKFRRGIRRKMRNLTSLGRVSFESVCHDAGLAVAFEEFAQTEASSWKGSTRTALLYDHARRRFYETLTAKLAATNRCFIDIMRLDGRPIAAQYAVAAGDTYYLLKIGYDPQYKAQSPGALLLDHTLEACSGHPVIRRISFVTGAKWNDDWAPRKSAVFNHYVYRGTLKGRLGLVLHRLKQHAIGFRNRYADHS